MSINYFLCEVCWAHLAHRDETNKNKFPVTRKFENNNPEQDLLSVRCAECVLIPYKLEEGYASRSYRINADGVHILASREYNHWSYGIGHLLELYFSPDEGSFSFYQNCPVEIGFLYEEEVNLIVLAHRFVPYKWHVTPYQWYKYADFARVPPPTDLSIETERQFKISIINDDGGKYLVIRKGIMPLEFAEKFHAVINKQIEQGIPNVRDYYARENNLWELLIDNKVDSLLEARTELYFKNETDLNNKTSSAIS